MKSKKIVALLLAVVMCLGMLAACGGGDTANTPAPSAPAASAPAAENTPAAPSESVEPTPTPVPTPEPIVGEAGMHTYNSATSVFGTNWNPHIYQTTDDGDILAYQTDGFFVFDYNEDRTGYAMVPSMVTKDPEDVTSKYVGKFGLEKGDKARAWKYTLKDNLKWDDGTPITAYDYVESAKRLLNPAAQNYRADSLYTGSGAVVGAESYVKQGQYAYSSFINSVGYFAIEDLETNSDGQYVVDGSDVWVNIDSADHDWGTASLAVYVANYCDADHVAMYENEFASKANENGYVAMNEETTKVLCELIANMQTGGTIEDYAAQAGDYAYQEWEEFCKLGADMPAVDFDTVGIFAESDHELVIVLKKALSGFYLKYYIDGGWLVKTDLYDACESIDNAGVYSNTYGTSVETSASYGAYKLTTFQMDKRMVFSKNENWHGFKPGQYETDRVIVDYVPEPSVRLELFLQGRLDSYGLQVDDMATYQLSDHTYYATGASTYFMVFNPGLSQLEEKQAAAGANINKTIITVKEFRMAMSFAMDRAAFCLATSPTNHPTFAVYSDLIVCDAEAGTTFRSTPQAKQVVADFWDVADDIGPDKMYADIDEACASITGYNLAMAQEYFDKAYDIAIAEGLMTENDTIEIMVGTPNATSKFYNNGYNFIVNNYTEAVKGTKLEGKLTFKRDDTLGNAFSNALKTNQVDMLFGVGWSGSALDPYNLWEAYVGPSYQYDANVDYSKVMLDVKLSDGKTYTADMLTWMEIMNGEERAISNSKGKTKMYSCGLDDNDPESRLNILAASEGMFLQQYNMLPLMDNSSAQLKGQQVTFGTEDYIFGMGFGGIQYYTYNYDDAEWDAFVAANGGVLDYT